MEIRVFDSKRTMADGGRRAGRRDPGGGDRRPRPGARDRGDRRVAVRVPRRARARRPGSTGRRWSFFHLDEYVGAARHAPGELPPLPARADRRARPPRRVPLRRGRRGRPRGRVPPRRRAARRAPDRRGLRRASARTATSRSTTRRPTSRREEPYLVLALDEACRRQQLGEGWFATARGRAGARDLDVDPPDPRGRARSSPWSPTCARRRRCGTAWSCRSARCGRPRSSGSTRARRCTSTAQSASLLVAAERVGGEGRSVALLALAALAARRLAAARRPCRSPCASARRRARSRRTRRACPTEPALRPASRPSASTTPTRCART